MLSSAKVVCIHDYLPPELAIIEGNTVNVNDVSDEKSSENRSFRYDNVLSKADDSVTSTIGEEISETLNAGMSCSVVTLGCGQHDRLFYGNDYETYLNHLVWVPVEKVFNAMSRGSKAENVKQWSMDLTFIEVYCDQYSDLLLAKEVQKQNAHLPSNTLKLRSQPELGKFIEGAQQVTVSSSRDFQKVVGNALVNMRQKEDFSVRSAVLKVTLRVFDIGSDTTTTNTLTVTDIGIPFRFGRSDVSYKGPSAKKLVASYAGVKNLLQTIRSTPLVGLNGQRPNASLVNQYNAQRRDAKRASALTSYIGDDLDGNTKVYAFGFMSLSLENFDTELKLLSLLHNFTYVRNEVSKEGNVRQASSTAIQLKNEISRLKRELEKCKESEDDDDEDLLNKTIQMHSTAVQLEVFQMRVDEMGKATENQRSQVSEVELKCQEQRERLDTINSKLLRMQSLSNATFETEKDIDNAVEDRLVAEKELRKQFAMTRHASLRIKQLQGSLSELEHTADGFVKQKQQLADSQKQHREEIAAGIFNRILLEHRFGCERKQLTVDVKRARAMLNVETAKSKQRMRKIDDCTKETAALEASHHALSSFLQHLLDTDEVKVAEAEQSALQDVVRLQESQLSITKRELAQVTEEITGSTQDIERLANELQESTVSKALQAQLNEHTRLDEELAETEHGLCLQDTSEEEMQCELAQLGEEIDDLNILKHSMDTQERQITSEIDELSAEVEEVTMLLDVAAAEHGRLAEQLEVELMDSAAIKKSYHHLCNTTASRVLPS